MDRSKSVLISVIVVLLLGLGYVLFFTSSDVSLEDTVTKEKVTVDVEKAPSEVDKSFVSQEEEIDTEVVATSSDDTEDTTISEDMTVYEAPESGETGNEDEKNQLKDMFLDDSFGLGGRDRLSNYWGLENVGLGDDGYVKILFPKGSYKPSAEPRGGAGFIYEIQDHYEKLALSYNLRFASNFDFVKGGKLPGLCGGQCPRGGMDKDKGFSLRFAWKRDGELDVLNYGADTGTYGDFVGGNFFQFVPETDYTITQEVVLNTPGNADGYLGVVVNGKKVYESNTMVYRNNAEVQIDSLLFATFFGGSDESWATPNDTYLEIKNFRISDDFEYSMVK